MLINHEVPLLFAPMSRRTLDCMQHTLANQGTTLKCIDIYCDLSEQTPIIVKLVAQLEQEREELNAREAPGTPVAAITGPRTSGP